MKDLQNIAKQIQKLDEQIFTLMEQKKLLKENLTREEKNELFKIIMNDGKKHID